LPPFYLPCRRASYIFKVSADTFSRFGGMGYTRNFWHFGLIHLIENEGEIPCRFYNTGIDETAAAMEDTTLLANTL